MSSKNDLDCEDFAEITLVRMEDVQPSRGCQNVIQYIDEVPVTFENCADDSYVEYIDDENSNIGSMVSIKSETIPSDHTYSEKYIVPDSTGNIPSKLEYPQVKTSAESWPTLEILPGGVIKNYEQINDEINEDILEDTSLDTMYACALCPVGFKYLYSLVKHVRTHKEKKIGEQKASSDPLKSLTEELIINKNCLGIKIKEQLKNKTHKKGVAVETKRDIRRKPLILQGNGKNLKRLKMKVEPRNTTTIQPTRKR